MGPRRGDSWSGQVGGSGANAARGRQVRRGLAAELNRVAGGVLFPWFKVDYAWFSAGSGLSQVKPRSVWLISNQGKPGRLVDAFLTSLASAITVSCVCAALLTYHPPA
jgi:hypothetical protein